MIQTSPRAAGPSLLVISLVLAGSIASPVLAQTATAEPPVNETAIVVAQKREQAAQDVPIALSVFSAATLGRMDELQQVSFRGFTC
jgi:FlaG/FlaF family flagellin (archaellin)